MSSGGVEDDSRGFVWVLGLGGQGCHEPRQAHCERVVVEGKTMGLPLKI